MRTLLHCISSDTNSPQKDYKTIRDELGRYNPKLLEKPEIVFLTKSDLVDKKETNKLKRELDAKNREVISISIHDFKRIEKLKKRLLN